jgi:hypothetical protein
MRKYFVTAFVLVAMLMATTGFALEKTAAVMNDDRAGGFNAATTCTVTYYNFCTGWVWIWSGWSAGDCVGVCFDNCCNSDGVLDATDIYVWTGAPSGYGFTGTAQVNGADNKCCPWPATPFAAQPYLPFSGWNTQIWGVPVPNKFVVQWCLGTASILPNPTAYATDHPAAGPTGPQACGTCYPLTRENRSFYYGSLASPLCPGSPLNDGICDAQLLSTAYMTCLRDPVSVEEVSWTKIKSLYR